MSKEAAGRDAILPKISIREMVGMSPMQQNFVKLMTVLIAVMVFLIGLSVVLGT
jgi:hypothetical protein